jgi:hypothetical protein
MISPTRDIIARAFLDALEADRGGSVFEGTEGTRPLSIIGNFDMAAVMDRVMDRLTSGASPVIAAPAAARVDGSTSDGHHTFDELYRQRMLYHALWANLVVETGNELDFHKSWRHDTGELCFGGGWFIVVGTTPDGLQFSNHYPEHAWRQIRIPEREFAVTFDGHTPTEAMDRLESLIHIPTGVQDQ